MSALTFTLKTKPTFRLDCSALTPNKLAGLTVSQIKKIPLFTGRNAPKVGDYFEVAGTDASHIIFKKTTVECDYIGSQMKSGEITVADHAGDYLGAKMRGGIIICKKNAGDRVADQMRRGLILIDGDVGAYCGSRMISGTIGVYGNTGDHIGYCLRRGTLLLTNAPAMQATWQDCGSHNLPFLSLMYNSFKSLQSKFSKLKNTRAQRWMGDISQNGTGEILFIKP